MVYQAMSSPTRKRVRLSSPTCDRDYGVPEIGLEGLEELNRIELSLSQQQNRAPSSSQRRSQGSQTVDSEARERRLLAIMAAIANESTSDNQPNQGQSSRPQGQETKRKRELTAASDKRILGAEGMPSSQGRPKPPFSSSDEAKRKRQLAIQKALEEAKMEKVSEIEVRMSPPRPSPQELKERRLAAITSALREASSEGEDALIDNGGARPGLQDENGPSSDSLPSFPSAAVGFAPAAILVGKCDDEHSSSPDEPPPEPDYSKWFDTSNTETSLLPGFQISKSLLATPAADTSLDYLSDSSSVNLPVFTTGAASAPTSGFSKASTTQTATFIQPSKDALELAAKRLEEWSKEESSAETAPDAVPPSNPSGVFRPVLAPLLNSPSLRGSCPSRPTTPEIPKGKESNRVFKSPLLGNPSPKTMHPNPRSSGAFTSRSTRPHPLASTPLNASSSPERPARSVSDSVISISPPNPSTSLSTPVRPSSGASFSTGSARRVFKTSFSTPFKKGMGPGEPGRAMLEKAQKMQKTTEVPKAQHKTAGQLDLAGQHPPRRTLGNSGLVPQRYTADELESIGVNFSELRQITPQTALFYSFYTSTSQIPSVRSPTAPMQLGPDAALVHLLQSGRSLATREWVANHYALILWKLAGLACLEPHRESTEQRRWSWSEVLRQLESRYTRELAEGVRPALRCIATQDRPASSPMVLCISDVIEREPEKVTRNGQKVPAVLELELTDGWYRLRATLDDPLARAVRRGKIRAGRKVAFAGARLDNQRKDPTEILQAYESTTLRLHGNATHLAPWHAKLGFQERSSVATLNHLTPDGGLVVLMDFVVEKVHSIAFLETIEDEDGKIRREGPRMEVEETEVNEKWKRKREAEEAKLREGLDVRWNRWEALADRLERAAGSRFNPGEDEMPPDHIEDLFEEMDCMPAEELTQFVKTVTASESGWLARFLRAKTDRDKELAIEDIETELKHRCPPRDVRSFRVVKVRDSRTQRRPGHRAALLTVWDVLNLCFTEGGKAGLIEEGQRFLVTCLVPAQKRSWMGLEEGAEVYLNSTRNSRFTRLK